MALTCLRWLLVSFALVVLYQRDVRQSMPVIVEHKWFLLLTGALGFTIFNLLFYSSAHYTTAINILIIQGALPLFVLLASVALYRRRINVNQIVGMMLTFFGVAYLATKGRPELLFKLDFNRGDLLMILACIIQAAYFILISRKPPLSSAVLFCALAFAAFLTSLPLLVIEMLMGQTQFPTVKGLWLLAYVTVFPSTLSQIFFIIAIARIGPDRTGFFVNLVPIFGSGLAILLLGETPHTYHAVALGCVVSGIVAVEMRRKR
jgi:drug/metabolite transporter (DMT)-like permease